MGNSHSPDKPRKYVYKGLLFPDSYKDELFFTPGGYIPYKLKNNPNKVLLLPPISNDLYRKISDSLSYKSKIWYNEEGKILHIVTYHPITNAQIFFDLEKHWIGG